MATPESPFFVRPDRAADRPAAFTLAAVLAALDPLPAEVAAARYHPAQLRPVLFQWLTVLETADIAELEGLTDDLRELADSLPDTGTEPVTNLAADPATALPAVPDHTRAALHRAGLSLERVAAWGRPAGVAEGLFALGRHLLALSERA